VALLLIPVLSIGTSFANLSSSERLCEEDMMIEGKGCGEQENP
jgi:hypothetical protein